MYIYAKCMGKYFWTEAFVTNTHVQYTCSALKTLTPHRTHITEYLQVRNLEQMTVKRHIGAFQHARTHTHNLLTFPRVSLPHPGLFSPFTFTGNTPTHSHKHLCKLALELSRTFASRPIWSSVRRLLVRPGVLVGSPPSPSTPGQTFRSCMP